jgi:hypothetical protein
MQAVFFFTHFFHFFYGEPGEPWYHAAVWGNIVAVTILAPCGYIWAKSKFWPLNLIHAKLNESLAHHRHLVLMAEEMHTLMHTGNEHPRVTARREAGEHPTPKGEHDG